jgi:hypothetical protein
MMLLVLLRMRGITVSISNGEILAFEYIVKMYKDVACIIAIQKACR